MTSVKLKYVITIVNFNNFQNSSYQENLLLRSNDITLSNIDCLYQIVDGKRRVIGPQSKISSKLEGIQIVCKVC